MNTGPLLVTGASGQVGFELVRQASLFGQVLAPRRSELNLIDADAVDGWLREHRPSVILNAAAYTAVDKAEDEINLAVRLNEQLPAQLSEYAAASGATLIHYSSDYVYPGDGQIPWTEDSAPGPLNVYGRTKLAGDLAVSRSGCPYLIFRTSWVYSARGHNFMKTMLRLGKTHDSLSVVGDQIGAPTPARLIAQVTAHALGSSLPRGIYHLAPKGQTSWHGFASEIFRMAASAGSVLSVCADAVEQVPTSAYSTRAHRPLNSRLNIEKIEEALQISMPHWQDQLRLTIEEFLNAE